MTISPFRYAGSKNKLLPILIPYLDPLLTNSTSFVEPFVGGGSVVLEIAQKYPKLKLFVNDGDQWVAAFWKIVSGPSKRLQELLDALNLVPDLKTFQTLSKTPTEGILEAAVKAIFFNRTTFSGLIKRDSSGKMISSPIGGWKQKSKYKVNCRYNYKKLKQKILNCHELLAGRTEVSNVDFSQYDPLINTDLPTYLDPPYVIKGGMLYNENMNLEQHQQLAQILQNRKNWVASYDDCSEIKELYKNNKIIELSAKYTINGAKKNWTNKNELIILP